MRLSKLLGALLIFGFASGSVLALEVKVNGDLNNRAMVYTNQTTMFDGVEGIASEPVSDEGGKEAWMEIKYRLGASVGTDDGAVRGVYMLELGAIRFGDSTRGGAFSGDGNNYETRFAYADVGIPGFLKNRLTIGLQPFTVNRFLWNETAMGMQLKGPAGPMTYTVAWMRGFENTLNTTESQALLRDADNLLVRGDFAPSKVMKVGVFGLWQHAKPGLVPTATVGATSSYLLKAVRGIDYNLYAVGVDGGTTVGPVFVNWDAIYQGGETTTPVFGAAAVDADLQAFFAHADVGFNMGPAKITYTGWYASGDDDDEDINNFIATDVDTFDSIIFFEGGYTDDNYFTEAPYFLDRGAIFNKLAVDFKATPTVTLSAAAIYAMTAEDLTLVNGDTTKNLGTEFDAAISYKPNANLEFALNGGYLVADDGMDFFEVDAEQNGESDSDIFRSTFRVRYMF
jgi:hypothetical protein